MPVFNWNTGVITAAMMVADVEPPEGEQESVDSVQVTKEECEYCSTWNPIERAKCETCNAPLPFSKPVDENAFFTYEFDWDGEERPLPTSTRLTTK
jgi:hypothetical protein